MTLNYATGGPTKQFMITALLFIRVCTGTQPERLALYANQMSLKTVYL